MKIADIKKLDIGTKGFSVEAQVLRVMDIRTIQGEHGAFKRQNILLVDGNEKIFISIGDNFITNRDIGKPIAITNCELGEYEDKNGDLQFSLEATGKDSTVKMERTPSQTGTARRVGGKMHENVTPAKSFEQLIGDAIDEAQKIVDHPAYMEFIDYCKNKGLTTEDARALIIGRIITQERKN